MEQNCLKCYSCWDVYIWTCRLWGTATAMLLWGVAVEITYYRAPGFHVGYYLIFAAMVVSFFEAVFIVIFWINLTKKEEKTCCVCTWKKVFGWVDDWKKGFIYIVLSGGCFMEPKTEWLAIIPGVMMIISGILYVIKTVKTRRDEKEEELRSKNQTYGRFDVEVQEDIEESAVSPANEDPLYKGQGDEIEETVGEQDEILDV